ncbi:MAG: zinc metallopeptidase [Bacteroidota bacterium]
MLYPAGIIFFLISTLVSLTFRSRITTYFRTRLQADLSGAEVATKMLQAYGIHDVKVTSTKGQLTDHYNPLNKIVNLSAEVYRGRNAAAAAIAAHECGHAVQHAKGYIFLRLRSAMVPALSATSRWMPWIILLGIFAVNTTPIPLEIGIALFSLTTLFTFITLPVEFDASRRALAWIDDQRIVTNQERRMAKDALWWAAMTYVVAALGSLAELLHLISILQRRRS